MSRDKNLQDFWRFCITWPSLCQDLLRRSAILNNVEELALATRLRIFERWLSKTTTNNNYKKHQKVNKVKTIFIIIIIIIIIIVIIIIIIIIINYYCYYYALRHGTDVSSSTP